jgi:hypothetical protein
MGYIYVHCPTEQTGQTHCNLPCTVATSTQIKLKTTCVCLETILADMINSFKCNISSEI